MKKFGWTTLAALGALLLMGGLMFPAAWSHGLAAAAENKADKKVESSLADLLKTFDSEFVAITPGEGQFPKSFVMGTDRGPLWEEPAHKVTFDYAFHIAKYEVPQNLYAAVMGQNPSRWKGPRNSAENFTRDDAVAFCRKITGLLREAGLLKSGEVIRLPTEAEWEYCCRAGTTTPYSFGESAINADDRDNKATILSQYGWHTGNAAGNDPPVGALKPNPWGLYDMHGYLWEFVADDWHNNYAGAPANGKAWTSEAADPLPVVRGGSWRERYECHRSAFRMPAARGMHNEAIGFRCVKAKMNEE